MAWENSEPRPPETTGALPFEGAPKGPLQYRVKLASHDRAAIVQQVAKSGWLTNRSFFCDFFVAKTAAVSPSSSANRVIGDSVTAAKRARSRRVDKSVAGITGNISEPLKVGGTTRTASVRIVIAKRVRK